MATTELRDLDQARRFLRESLWLQRVVTPAPATVRPALEWALEVASSGQALPSLGFLADLGHAAFALDQGMRAGREPNAVGLPAGLTRMYEDHVLGKLYADYHFERAGDALRRLQGRDRARGLAFVLNQFRERADFPGVHLSPALIKGLQEMAPEENLARGWESLSTDGLMPLIVDLTEGLIAATRRVAELLGPEDIFELEHGTALADLGQRVALRQLLHAAQRLETALPAQRIRPLAGRQEVPTRVLDEDTYPVGGYSSVSTRGSIESLLHSQLAYMEPDERPDLFDVKFLRDELLYYSRDENQFLRRRRNFVFALLPDLMHTRYKDPTLPWQRGVLWLGLLVAAVRKLSEWLTTDALVFEFWFVDEGKPEVLAHEQDLIRTVLREGMANGSVRVARCARVEEVAAECGRRARRSLSHCLVVAETPPVFHAEDTQVTRLRIDGPRPALGDADAPLVIAEGDEPLDSWGMALEELLRRWV